jgi:hypothetical protein
MICSSIGLLSLRLRDSLPLDLFPLAIEPEGDIGGVHLPELGRLDVKLRREEP